MTVRILCLITIFSLHVNSLHAQIMIGENLDSIAFYAKQGIPKYQAILGEVYRRGYPLKKDYNKAFTLFKKSADEGEALGLYNIAIMYENGYGTIKDTSRANEYYKRCIIPIKKLAESGDVRAMFSYGVLLDSNIGILNDEDKSKFWFRKSAKKGHPISMNNLAADFQFGNGVEINLDSAIFYFSEASKLSYPNANDNLGDLYLNDLKDTTKAMKYYRIAASQGLSESMWMTADIYRAKQDSDSSLYWYTSAAENGEPRYQRQMAEMYENGYLGVRDYEKSFYWFSEAANNNDLFSIYKLGWYYTDGIVCSKDFSKAKYLFSKSYEYGYLQSGNALKALEIIINNE